MRKCEIDLKDNDDYDCIITCEKCKANWKVNFEPHESFAITEEEIISISSLVKSGSDTPTKEPINGIEPTDITDIDLDV
jgi:hypothetical protein